MLPSDEGVINDGGALGRAEAVVTSKGGQGPLRASPIQDEEAVLIDQVQEVAATASGLLRRMQCRLVEDLGISSSVRRVMKTACVSKSPGFFLFSADIGVKVSNEEARQRSRERGVGIQDEGESNVELLDRGSYFLRGGI